MPKRRKPLTGKLTVEWRDAGDPNDASAPPDFGHFGVKTDPPLESERLLALLRSLATDLENDLRDEADPPDIANPS